MNDTRYQIDVSAYRCAACDREIACGAGYYSAVTFGEEGFRRLDYCASCWRPQLGGDGGDESSRREVFFAHWKTARPVPPKAEARRVRFDPALVMEFFRRLSETPSESQDARDDGADGQVSGSESAGGAGEGQPRSAGGPDGDGVPELSPQRPDSRADVQKRDLRFVLALLLVRKKLLNFESSVARDGVEWLHLTERGDASRVHWVENPSLTDQELENVRDGIGDLLQMRV